MWPQWPAIILELIKAVFGLGLLAAGWFVGQRIVASWDLRKKRQELDVNTAVQFQQLYGELKEVGRLWREANKPEASGIGQSKDLRWSLLTRSTNAESKFEAVIMKLASERALSPSQITTLGLFRQACQQLRQSIRTSSEVSWSDFGPEYFLFNDLAAGVTCLIGQPRPHKAIPAGVACANLNRIAGVRGSDWKEAANKYHALYSRGAHGIILPDPVPVLSAVEKLALPPAPKLSAK